MWRKKNEAFKPQNLIPTIKHGSGNVKVWGSIAASGVGNLVVIEVTMDPTEYRNILRNYLKVSAQRLGLGNQWVFQQDDDPKHTAHAVREWVLYNVPKQLHSPLQSPDLNPIENIWGEVEWRVSKYRVTNKETKKDSIRKAWSEIKPEINENLMLAMPRILHAVIDANGGPTNY